MLIGTADPEHRADRAPEVVRFDIEPVSLEAASVLQVICEIDSESMCEMLPPALHPTLPPAVNWLVYDCPTSPWGPMRIAQTRIECRSGTRPRGLLSGAICNNPEAARALASDWGYSVSEGTVEFRRSYDEIRSRVAIGGQTVLEIGLRNPQVLGLGDIQFVAGMHPAHTPKGYRLLQCAPGYTETEAYNGTPIVEEFDPEAWGDERIDPVYPVSAAFCSADIRLPTIRFACRPGELAFTGTERV